MNRKNLQIECLRGAAILIIVIFHVFCRFQQLYMDNDIPYIGWFGNFGATLFMLITAFFLGKSYEDFKFFPYIRRKLLRLWPVYFISVSISFATLQIFRLPGRTVDFREFLLNIFFINGYIGYGYVDSAHWYLTVIISFIIITGIFHKAKLSAFPEMYYLWMGTALVCKLADIEFMYKLLGSSYIGIACVGGILFKLIHLKNNDGKNKFILLTRYYIAMTVGLLYTFMTKGTEYVIYIIVLTPVIYLAFTEKLNFLTVAPLAGLGTISYSVYLIHQNISFVLELFLIDNTNLPFWAVASASMAASFLSGVLLYFAAERPINKFIQSRLLQHSKKSPLH